MSTTPTPGPAQGKRTRKAAQPKVATRRTAKATELATPPGQPTPEHIARVRARGRAHQQAASAHPKDGDQATDA